MASLLNLPGIQDIYDGTHKWASSDDLRARLLMTNTTADTENNKATLSAYTTIDTFDGSGATNNLALTGEAVNVDSGNNRLELDLDDAAFGALGNGTRQIQGVLLFFFVTNDADSIPLCFIQFSSNVNPGGATLTIQWNAEGVVQVV
jgi:hypothetical protein